MTPLIQLALTEMPTIIAGFRALFAQHHPDEPQPTDAEVIAAFHRAFDDSLAKDVAWLAAHPIS